MCAPPPSYSLEFEGSVPSYSSEPLYGERRLEQSPRKKGRHAPTGTLTKSNSRVTLFLSAQDDEATSPTYHRNGCIRGEVFVKDVDREDITAVTVKVRTISPENYPDRSTHFFSIAARRYNLSHTIRRRNKENSDCCAVGHALAKQLCKRNLPRNVIT